MRLEHDYVWDDCVVPHMESMEASFGRQRLFEESIRTTAACQEALEANGRDIADVEVIQLLS
ncbi:unnamed protein product [Brassica rapa]|uniref:Uncharacterized protein n=2 Tax=Brassica TaxID=3705 RepID=A0A3P5Y2S4_BRACM|nr:unnamed protein product [Brassica napus]CAG7864206.1 unnamed protein product [Brassica rapa]VDC61466.1 unnamed protein product [Brassica rapa]